MTQNRSTAVMQRRVEAGQPPETRGKRVIVTLRNDEVCGREPVSSTAPIGWAADICSWADRGFAFDIVAYEVCP